MMLEPPTRAHEADDSRTEKRGIVGCTDGLGDWFPAVGIRRHANIGEKSSVCFQREIRDKINAENPRPQIARLNGAMVVEIPPEKARPIIYKYEWLGTMGRSAHCCGLMLGGELLGVACFGWPAGPESRDICGKENRNLAICLERGACVHYAPKNAGSYLVANACKLIAKNHKYRIFYAYSDEDAGEIGTIYQACNWLYIGQGVGRTPGRLREYYLTPENKIVSCRTLRHRGITKTQALAQGWQVRHQKPKHKYVWIEGNKTERKRLLAQLRYPVLAYPKREVA